MKTISRRKKEIWDMATLMTDEDNPTNQDIASLLEPAQQVINGVEWALKLSSGKIPRPPQNNWLEELQAEIDSGDYSYEDD